MRTRVLWRLCAVALLLLGAGGAQAQYANVPMTGYTADIVADGNTAVTGVTTPGGSTTHNVDSNISENWVFEASNFSFNGTACGTAAQMFPASGLITSTNATNNTGIAYQLQAYGNGAATNNNSLRLSGAGTFGKLTPVTPFQAAKLYFVCLGGNGGVTFSVNVKFTDSSSELINSPNAAPDWCGGAATYKLTTQQYYRIKRTATNCGGAPCPYLYEIPISISAANYSKTIAYTTITNTTTTGAVILHVLAVGAQSVCATPAAQAGGPLALTPISTGTISGSFSAASPVPTGGYLVVRYPSGATATNPVSGTTYTTGNTLGTGKIVSAGTGTTFSATGLSGATTYDFYVYTYATGGACGGPVYNTTAPLTGSATTNACGTMSGTVAVGPGLPNTYPGGFTSLTQALSYITTNGLGGNTVLELQAGYDGTAPNETFPIAFPLNPCVNSAKTLTVRPAAGVNGLVITNSTTAPTIYLSGATYVTIDGRPGGTGSGMAVPNTNNLAIISTNTAVNSTAVKMANDASNNTIQYCDLQGANTTNTSNTECGVVFIGTTNVAGGLGNDNNAISFCNIHGVGSNLPAIGVYSYGYIGGTPSLTSTFNDNNTVADCNIYDFYSGTIQSSGLKMDGGTNAWTISANSFFQTGTRTYTTTNQHRAIWLTPSNGGGGNGFTVTNNYIGGSAPVAGGAAYTMTGASTVANNFWAMDVSVIGSVAAIPATASVIQGNTFTNFSLTTGATTTNDYLRFIGLSNTGSVNIINNVMGSATGNTAITVNNIGTSTGAIIGYGIKVSNAGTCSVSGNQLGGMTFNASGNYPFQFAGIYVSGGTAIGITNNTVGSSTTQNSIHMSSAATLGGSTGQAVTGIQVAGGTTITALSGNTIANLHNAYTGTNGSGQTRGIVISSAAPNMAAGVVNNTIKNLSNATTQTGTGTGGAIVGISFNSTNGAGCNVTGNKLDSFVTTATTAATNISGIYYAGTTSVTNLIARNLIHSLQVMSNATASYVIGIELPGAAGNNTLQNNMIQLGINPDGTSSTNPTILRGIFCNTTNTTKLYYNTIYIGGTGAGNANSTYAVTRNVTSGTYDIRNNVLVNARSFTSAGAGTIGNYAIHFNTAATGVTLNNNLYYATGTGGYIGFTGAAQQVAYAANWISGDNNSQSGDPLFLAPTATAAGVNLHLTPAGNVAESGGVAIAGINDDYDGDIRQGSAGYAGTGTAPDLGADEFAGTAVTPVLASTSINPATPNCTTSVARTITADVTATGAAITGVQLNYYVNGVAQPSVTMTLTSGTGAIGTTSTYSGSIPAVTPINATVTWSVAATTGAATAASASASYSDVPLGALSASATASANPICNGTSTTLTGLFTNIAATYATPPAVGNPTTDEDLGTVKISQGATTILNNVTPINNLTGTIGTATGTTGSYSNFTSFGPYTIQQGQAYTLTVSVLQAATAFNNFVAAWIDYNHDGDFVDAGENIYLSPTYTSGAHTETASFTVPAAAALGKVRMRVLAKESTTLSTDPAQAVSWGEYEEYMLNILPNSISYSWSDGASAVGTTNPLTVTPVNTTNASVVMNYTASMADAGSGCSLTATIPVTVGPSIVAPTATNSNHCGSQVPTASVADPNSMPGALFKWYAAASGGTALQSSTSTTYTTAVSTTTTFYVAVGDPVSGCESARTAVTVTVSQPDAVSVTAPLHVCNNAAVPLSVTQIGSINNYTYTWSATPAANSGIAGTPTGASQSFTPTVGGTYIYTVTAVDGACIATASASVDVLDLSGSGFVVTNPGCSNNPNSPGSISVNAVDVVPTTTSTIYSNNFTSATLTPQASLAGASASITGGVLQLTPNTGGALGGFEVLNSGAASNPNAGLTVSYDFITTGANNASSSADGMSWSFGDDVVPTPANLTGAAEGSTVAANGTNAENGSGTKLKVSFDAYGTAGGGIAGIYVMYNNPILNQPTTVTSTMLAYSSDLSWKGGGVSKPISIQVDNTGKLTVKVAGVSIPGVTNIQLPAAYLSANKSGWKHEFSARTGGVAGTHQMDNLAITYVSQPYTYEYSTDGTSYQASSVFAHTPGTYPVSIRYASGECQANLGNAVIAPAPAIPTISVTPNNPAYCGAGTAGAALTASGADTYAWTPATGLSATTGASVTATPATTSTYVVTGTTTAGCSNTASVTVASVVVSAATATPATVCAGSPSQLQVSATPIISTYCVPGTSNGTAHWVQSFSLAAGATPLVTNNNSGVAAAPRYTDYGTTKTTGNAVVGTTYTISAIDAATTTDYGGISVFVDYNQNGTFENTERVYNIYDGATQVSPYTGSFVIPATAYNGTTKVRVRCDWGYAANVGCESYNIYGETEDYTINVTGGTPNTAASYSWTPAATLSNAAIGNPVATPQSTTPGQMDTAIYDVVVSYGSCSVTKHDTLYVRPTGQWLGTTADWNTPTNWCGGLPTATSDVIIPNATAVPFTPMIMTGNTGDVRDIRMDNNSVLSVAGGGTLNLYGDVDMTGAMASFDASGGTVNFTGGNQTILPGFIVGTLSIGGGATKTLAGDVTVSSALTFNSGMIDVTGNNLTLEPGATINGAGPAAYVKTSAGGRLSQTVAPGASATFPVGNSQYNPATLANSPTATADVYSVSVRDELLTNGTSGTAVDPTTTYAAEATWDVTEATIGGSDVTMTLQFSQDQLNSPSFDMTHVYISHYDATTQNWDCPFAFAYQAPAATGTGPYFVSRSGIESFSPFAVGSAGGASPLPVTLVRLEATNQGARNKVEWETASEHDMASYIVERSTDGKTFARMDEVTAAGHAQGYITYDNQPAQGLTYYRLKMMGTNNDTRYSQTVKAFMGRSGEVVLTASPNPVRDLLTIQVYGATDGDVQLTDVSGRVVTTAVVNNGQATFATNALASGTYFVRWTNGTATQTLKVTKQ